MADGLNYSSIAEVSKRNLMTSAICDGEGHCFNQHGAMTATISPIQEGIPMPKRENFWGV